MIVDFKLMIMACVAVDEAMAKKQDADSASCKKKTRVVRFNPQSG